MSFAQQRLWFLAQFDERAAQAYTLSGVMDLHGALDLPALQQALDHIVARHEVLRTCFLANDDGATQVIAPAKRRRCYPGDRAGQCRLRADPHRSASHARCRGCRTASRRTGNPHALPSS
ncbi:condensation domain-containing protein [Xanthomonas sp. MUS 060]|uniref:condensation domain-containing protein n=1 Tax=Xanthomonas sp. MUS 060 TaxID=1588031 RepID=UPI00210145F5|nr:condensation domain-containing protein [Xanthomonas sp. MUS 060]